MTSQPPPGPAGPAHPPGPGFAHQPGWSGAGPYPPVPTPKRIRARWFWLPGILAALAVASFVGLLLFTVLGATKVDGTVPLDGTPVTISAQPNTETAIFAPYGSMTTCEVQDAASRQPIPATPPVGEFTRDTGNGELRQIASFNSGSGQLSVSCVGEGELAEVGPAVDLLPSILGIFATVLVPMLLGGLALVAFIVILVLYLRGRSAPPVPPGPGPRGAGQPGSGPGGPGGPAGR